MVVCRFYKINKVSSACNSQGYGVPQVSTPFSLNPHQKPPPPLSVAIFATSDTMLTVGWEHPQNNGGDPIKLYRVEWDTSGKFTSTSLPPHKGYADVDASIHSSHTIELLSNRMAYFVRGFAINGAGMGTPQTATLVSVSLSKKNTRYPTLCENVILAQALSTYYHGSVQGYRIIEFLALVLKLLHLNVQ